MSNETLNRSSASPSLTSKQISMSSMDISSLVNEPTMKASQSFDITNIKDEESQGDTKGEKISKVKDHIANPYSFDLPQLNRIAVLFHFSSYVLPCDGFFARKVVRKKEWKFK